MLEITSKIILQTELCCCTDNMCNQLTDPLRISTENGRTVRIPPSMNGAERATAFVTAATLLLSFAFTLL